MKEPCLTGHPRTDIIVRQERRIAGTLIISSSELDETTQAGMVASVWGFLFREQKSHYPCQRFLKAPSYLARFGDFCDHQ